MPPQKNPTLELQKQAVLRFVSEQFAIPLDQLARFLGIKHEQIVLVVRRLREQGCLNQRAVVATDSAWVWLTPHGAQLSDTGYPAVRDLAVRLLTHRRAINEVRLYLEARAPRGRWLCERAAQRELERDVPVPDGVFEIGAERHAIEVELSHKSRSALCEVIASHSSRYDAVVYFCSPQTRTLLKEVLEEGAYPKLIVRDVPDMGELLATRTRGFGVPVRGTVGQKSRSGNRRPQKRRDVPTPSDQRFLALIAEQGAIPFDQLARFLKCDETTVKRKVRCFLKVGQVKRARLLADEPDWVWLTGLGNRLSGMGFAIYLPAPGALARLRAMNEVRLQIEAKAPQARWIGWRTLRSELSGFGQIPNAVVEIGAERHAIEIELSRKEKEHAVQMIEHRSTNYDAVVCFCTRQQRRFYQDLTTENYWPKLIIRDLPGQLSQAAGFRGRFTDDELLVLLQEAASAAPGDLTSRAYTKYAKGRQASDGRWWPAYELHSNRFGSWKAALNAAGLDGRVTGGRARFTDDELVALLQEAASATSGGLTGAAYTRYAQGRQASDGRPWPAFKTQLRRFGSWEAALKAAGLEGRFTDDELIAFLQEADVATPDRLTRRAYTKYAQGRRASDGRRWPAYQLHRKRFGSWKAVLEAAGLKRVEGRFTDDELIAFLREVASATPGRLTQAAYAKYAKDQQVSHGRRWPIYETYLNRFGSWTATLQVAGVKGPEATFTDDELIVFLQEAAFAMPGRLTKRAYAKIAKGRQTRDGRPWPASETPSRRFGSWTAALQVAGLKSGPKPS